MMIYFVIMLQRSCQFDQHEVFYEHVETYSLTNDGVFCKLNSLIHVEEKICTNAKTLLVDGRKN